MWMTNLMIPHQTPNATVLSPILATSANNLIILNLVTRTKLGEQYRTLSSSLCSFLHSPVTSSPLATNIPLNTLFSNTLSLRSSLNVSDQVSHPHKTTGNVLLLLSYCLYCWIAKWKTKYSATKDSKYFLTSLCC